MLAIHCSCHHKAEEESGSGTCRRNRFRNNKIGVNTVKFLKMTLAILAIYSLIFLDTAFAKRDSVTGKYFSKEVDKLKQHNINLSKSTGWQEYIATRLGRLRFGCFTMLTSCQISLLKLKLADNGTCKTKSTHPSTLVTPYMLVKTASCLSGCRCGAISKKKGPGPGSESSKEDGNLFESLSLRSLISKNEFLKNITEKYQNTLTENYQNTLTAALASRYVQEGMPLFDLVRLVDSPRHFAYRFPR